MRANLYCCCRRNNNRKPSWAFGNNFERDLVAAASPERNGVFGEIECLADNRDKNGLNPLVGPKHFGAAGANVWIPAQLFWCFNYPLSSFLLLSLRSEWRRIVVSMWLIIIWGVEEEEEEEKSLSSTIGGIPLPQFSLCCVKLWLAWEHPL